MRGPAWYKSPKHAIWHRKFHIHLCLSPWQRQSMQRKNSDQPLVEEDCTRIKGTHHTVLKRCSATYRLCLENWPLWSNPALLLSESMCPSRRWCYPVYGHLLQQKLSSPWLLSRRVQKSLDFFAPPARPWTRFFAQNKNFRFLTHSRDLGAIPPPK